MRTIQMTLDDDLVTVVDRVSKELHTSRSAFARMALRDALERYSLEQLERKHDGGTSNTQLSPMSFRFGKLSKLGVMNETR